MLTQGCAPCVRCRTMQAAQATQAQTLDELKTRLQSVEGDIEAVQDDMSRLEDAIEAVQATQTSWAQTLGALAEDSVLVKRYLTKESKQLRRGVLVSKCEPARRPLPPLPWCQACLSHCSAGCLAVAPVIP